MNRGVDLSGRVAVITGSGRNLGRAYALSLGARGAAIIVNDVDEEGAARVGRELRDLGVPMAVSTADVGTAEGGSNLIDLALSGFGRIDVLVNNAGVRRPGYFEDLAWDEIDAVFRTHLDAAFFVSQPAWRAMAKVGYGRIIMTSSSSGLMSNHALSNYAAAKAGIFGLTKALAYEGQARGIHVNAILPFAVTIGVPVKVPDSAENRARFVSDADLSEIPPWRQDPSLCAELVSVLASESCEITGEAFSVCQGRFARVFVGVADGWLAPDAGSVTAENLMANMGQIRDMDRFTVPKWTYDEIADVVRRLLANTDR
jgi:NAD(P)-dependent dehydrogenase (short-subunit alcohol dehydrogenase family)